MQKERVVLKSNRSSISSKGRILPSRRSPYVAALHAAVPMNTPLAYTQKFTPCSSKSHYRLHITPRSSSHSPNISPYQHALLLSRTSLFNSTIQICRPSLPLWPVSLRWELWMRKRHQKKESGNFFLQKDKKKLFKQAQILEIIFQWVLQNSKKKVEKRDKVSCHLAYRSSISRSTAGKWKERSESSAVLIPALPFPPPPTFQIWKISKSSDYDSVNFY